MSVTFANSLFRRKPCDTVQVAGEHEFRRTLGAFSLVALGISMIIRATEIQHFAQGEKIALVIQRQFGF